MLGLWKGECPGNLDETIRFMAHDSEEHGVADLLQVGDVWILYGTVENGNFSPDNCSSLLERRGTSVYDRSAVVANLDAHRRVEMLPHLYAESAAVIRGLVTSMTGGSEWTSYRVVPSEVFRGPHETYLVWSRTEVGPWPEVGRDYVFFLHEDDGYLAQPCRVLRTTLHQDVVLWLRETTTPAEPVSWGRLKTLYGNEP
jgi:hypothetical protein